MNIRKSFLGKKPLPLLIPLTIAGFSPQAANALSLEATGVYSLGSAAPVTVTDGPRSTSVDIIPYVTDAAGNSAFFHVYGNSGNVFGSRSSGEGDFSALGTFSLKDTITNDTGAAGNFFLDYVITSGALGVNCFTGTTTCEGSARYDINIKVNGTEVESATGELMIDNAGTTLATTGFVLDGVTQTGVGVGSKNARYGWSDTRRVANLGFFDVGEMFSLDYELVTEATGAFGQDTSMSCFGGDLVEAAVIGDIIGDGGTSNCAGGSAAARSGDPNNIMGPSIVNQFNNIVMGIPSGPAGGGVARSGAAVPEPSSLVLMGVGLLAAFGLARKRLS